MDTDYEIVALSEEWFDRAAELLSVMWHLPVEQSRLRLRWKYLDCPLATAPLVFLAVHRGRVVATLAFFASPFRIGERRLVVLCPSDGIVADEHRRHGLYTRLLLTAHEHLATGFDFFISLSANPVSAAGLLKIGWRILAAHDGLSRFQLMPASRYLLRMPPAAVNAEGLVSDPAAIADLYEQIPATPRGSARCCLADPDRAYVEWRYANPTEHYVAIPCYRDSRLVAFAACMVSRRDVFVLDYRELPGANALGQLVGTMRKCLRVPRYNCYGDWLDRQQQEALRRLGFRDYRPLLNTFLDRPSVPVLIHPTMKGAHDSDWVVEGLDLSKAANWIIPEFCNDGY
ncbi:MAG: GNAT family N-acetyltransferase [Acidobacteria bacterium]|nr:GNAT family N-acetyltransferase [Acidobacteriota bacterium]